jgi:RNA polymerase sigma factor FliA
MNDTSQKQKCQGQIEPPCRLLPDTHDRVEKAPKALDRRFVHSVEPFRRNVTFMAMTTKGGGTQRTVARTAGIPPWGTTIVCRDELVLQHLLLVKAIAESMHKRLPVHVDLDDMIQAGNLGLLRAASKYDSEKKVAFSAYAKYRIRGAILDSLRQLDWASRDMRRNHKQVEAATHDLSATLQRAPTEAEIAEKLGMTVERLREVMVDICNVNLVSNSRRSGEDEPVPAPDFPDKPEGQPDWICERSELRRTLGDAVEILPERYQRVMLLYYYNEMNMREIGGVLGINESRVSQIHKSSLEKMATALKAMGITSGQWTFSSRPSR